MSATIVIKRGLLAGLPTGSAGEPLFTTDQFRLYVGSAGGNRLLGLLDKINGTTAPGVNDDAGAGYSPGSHWTDTTNANTYQCVSATTGAAVWKQTNNVTQTSVTGNAGTATALATGRTISITGDLAYTSPAFDGTGNVTAAGTLATVNSNVGSFGDATHVAAVTIDAKGRITAASSVAISSAPTGAAGGDLTGTYPNPTVSNTTRAAIAALAGAYLN